MKNLLLPCGSGRWLVDYRLVDYATQGYLLVVGMLVLCFHGESVPYWPGLVAAHPIGIGLVHWLIRSNSRRRPGGGLDFLRHFYPVLLYAGLYRETAALNQMFVTGYLDRFFQRLEKGWFGGQPSLSLMDWFPYVAVSELFYAAYFSYYAMIVGVGLALYLGNRGHYLQYVSVLSFVFYVCYLAYIFLPVVGPQIFFGEVASYQVPPDLVLSVPAYPAAVQAGPFYGVMRWVYRVFEGPGAAFPSSHVAGAMCTVFFSFRYLRSIRWVHLLAVLLLCVATVYCRYHYVVDVLAGFITGLILVPLGNWLYKRCADTQHAL